MSLVRVVIVLTLSAKTPGCPDEHDGVLSVREDRPIAYRPIIPVSPEYCSQQVKELVYLTRSFIPRCAYF